MSVRSIPNIEKRMKFLNTFLDNYLPVKKNLEGNLARYKTARNEQGVFVTDEELDQLDDQRSCAICELMYLTHELDQLTNPEKK